jgi:hypothetical protein
MDAEANGEAGPKGKWRDRRASSMDVVLVLYGTKKRKSMDFRFYENDEQKPIAPFTALRSFPRKQEKQFFTFRRGGGEPAGFWIKDFEQILRGVYTILNTSTAISTQVIA